jgi:hypothetical protein
MNEAGSATQPLCHWCNRAINSDELINVIVPRDPDDKFVTPSGPRHRQGSYIEEQAWHQVCFGVVQGSPQDD